MEPLISIVIPTKNGEHTIKRCLEGIANQTHNNVEVIIVDSGSTDGTIEITSGFDFVRVYHIDPSEFNHGLTRNLGVSKARGQFIVMTVQDAYPASDDWLERMLAHFSDNDLIGVCGQQVVPHDLDKNPHEWFRPYTKPVPRVIHFTNLTKAVQLSPKELHDACSWDNVNAMYRKSALVANPFLKTSFGEDMAWAKKVVLAGDKIMYDYNLRVYHYHHSTFDYTYKRVLTVIYFTYKNFGYVRQLHYDASDYLKVIYRNFKYKVSPKWIFFNWAKMKASVQAYEHVKLLLEKGEKVLDDYHNEKCGIPPQGKQNVSA